jgi:hypothetical protein
MEFSPTPVFYVFIGLMIGMVIGWVIGFFDSNSRTSKKIEAAEANAEIKMKEAERKIAEAEQNLQPSQTKQSDPSLLSLKKNDGRFTLEMDGVLVTDGLSIDRRKRLIELLTVFRLWLDGGQSSPAASQPAAPIPASRPPEPDPVQVAISHPVPVSLRNAPPPVPVPVTLQSLVQTKKPEPEKNIASLSIVQQIDTVLQERLLNSPLAKRGIRLQESIQGGVEVYVGLNKFLAVDDVPDEEIRTAIRAAIAEWEKKYTPGL